MGSGRTALPLLRLLGAALLLATFAAPAAARGDELTAADLTELSLEQLGEIEVTSVSRRPERLSQASASVYVISRDDIRRSGATSLPEALRLAPNLQVARADANQYAITARGFNSVLANKMLVLIDGRTVYSPLFSGVFWEAQEVVLDDIERIEVISGPGGTLWGTNAVNGVINVITRSARDTQGALASAGTGTTVTTGEIRFGGTLGSAAWRVFGRLADVEGTERPEGTDVGDASKRRLAGFRVDWGESTSTFMLQGSGYRGDIDQATSERILEGYHLLGLWNHRLGPESSVSLQTYFDRSRRDQPGAIREELDTWDVELHHGVRIGSHDVLWGGDYRHQPDHIANLGPTLAFIPADRDLDFGSVFVQDAVGLRSDLDLIVGVRFEHSEYTQWEHLPSARLSWRPRGERLLWAAYSRAVRAPSRLDRELFSPASPPFFVLAGGPDFISEISDVVELGYRAQPTPAVSYSITGYWHEYDRLRSLEPSPAGPVFRNGLEGTTTGGEAWASVRLAPWWRLQGSFVEQRVRSRSDAGVTDVNGRATLGNDPHRWMSLRASFDGQGGHELDLWARHVGSLPIPPVPSYVSLNARLGLRLPLGFDLSVIGLDLAEPRHAEWGAPATRPEFERSVFGQLRWRGWAAQ